MDYTLKLNGIVVNQVFVVGEHYYGPEYFWVQNTSNETMTLAVTKQGMGNASFNIMYSFDNKNWTNKILSRSLSIQVTAGSKVFFRGNNPNGLYKYQLGANYVCISADKTHSVGGDIMYLINADNVSGLSMPEKGFYRLFYNDSNLVDASALILPSSTNDYCYSKMFWYCTSLVNAPALPATTLAAYCYENMFCGCSSLVTAPALPATTLADFCYSYMFSACTNLVNPPALPATTLAADCYENMFRGCSSLVIAPALPATTLANYCYGYVFYGCTSLTSITVGALSWDSQKSYEWTNGVSSNGTFYKISTTNIPTSTSGIPTGWTVVNYDAQTVPSPVVTTEVYYGTCPDGITEISVGDVVTVTCSDQNATIYTRYVDGYWDEGLQEYIWSSDINQMPWNQSSNFVLYGDANNVNYLLQAKATRSGYNDSEIYETELQPSYEECQPDEPTDCTDCGNWEECGYESYEECMCQTYGEECPDCTDCNNWQDCEYESYEYCDFDNNGVLTQSISGGLDSRTESGSIVYTINARIYTGVPGCDYTIRKAGYPSNTYTDTNNNGYMLWTYDHADLVNGKSHFYVTVEKDGVSTGEIHYAAYDYGIETIE